MTSGEARTLGTGWTSRRLANQGLGEAGVAMGGAVAGSHHPAGSKENNGGLVEFIKTESITVVDTHRPKMQWHPKCDARNKTVNITEVVL